MNDLQKVFSYQESQVRTIIKNGEIWFTAKDVCEILKLEDVSKAVGRLDEDEKGTNLILTPGGPQEMLCVNEPGIYNLILGSRSRKSEIKAFKRWVTHEVIPSIRKTGKYEARPETVIDFLFYVASKPEFQALKASVQNTILRIAEKDYHKNISARSLKLPIDNDPTPSDLLSELLSHAVPWLTFIPRSETELKSSILYDEKFYYIFPWATEKHMKHPETKKRIYSEIKFLDGKNKNKKFKFWFNNESKNYHIWILPRKAVMLLPSLDRDLSAQVGGDGENK